MLISEVIAFLRRITNSSICQFVKRADSRGHQRHHLQGSRLHSHTVHLQQWLPSVGLFIRSCLTCSEIVCASGVHVKLSLSLAQACIGATTVAKLGKKTECQDTRPKKDLSAAASDGGFQDSLSMLLIRKNGICSHNMT